MDKTSFPIDDRLLDYLDGTLAAEERTALEVLIQQDTAVAARLDELRLMHMLMGKQTTELPSANFTAVVMQRLEERPASSPIRAGIFMVAAILLVVGIAAVLVNHGVFDTMNTVDLNDVAPERLLTDRYTLPSFLIPGRVIVNGIIMLNLALAFLVLDRTVLRPYFQRRLRGTH